MTTETETATSKTLILTAGIHGDEPGGLVLAQKINALIKQGGLCGRNVKVVFHGMLNPSGFAAGTRKNADGVDLNREWTVEGNSTGSPECAKVWADIIAARESVGDDMLVVDCHSLDGTPGVFFAGPKGRTVAEGCFRSVARVDTWTTAGTLTGACEAAGVTAIAIEVSKGESNASIATAAYQAICTWAAFGSTGTAA
jgi:predicted deacylase